MTDPSFSRFITFERDEWARLRAATPLTLSEGELAEFSGINERVSLDEVVQIYLPLSRLLDLYAAATENLYRVTDTFLGSPAAKVPYIIGIGGSVAVGKSTFARVLQALLARWPARPRVDLVTTDGFLYPNAELEARELMSRKGFPESYDRPTLVQFLADVKAGVPEVSAPVYSHIVYDIIPDERIVVRQPDILLVEGLNVLQTGPHVMVSDFFDFTIYVDATEDHIEQWYIERFLTLRDTIFRDPDSFFRHFAELTHDQAVDTARSIWKSINWLNLVENILPTRERAHLILEKGLDHSVKRVRLRKI